MIHAAFGIYVVAVRSATAAAFLVLKIYKYISISSRYRSRAYLGILRWANALSHKLEQREQLSLASYETLTTDYLSNLT